MTLVRSASDSDLDRDEAIGFHKGLHEGFHKETTGKTPEMDAQFWGSRVAYRSSLGPDAWAFCGTPKCWQISNSTLMPTTCRSSDDL